MIKITEIKKYPRFKDHFKVIFDNDSAVVIDAETIVKFSLKTGLSLTEDDFESVLKNSNSNRIMSYALYLISHKSYSRKDLYDKLISKGFDTENTDKTVNRLAELNYINDSNYALNLARYLKDRSKGVFYIKNELKSHGIASDIINDIFASELFSDDEPYLDIIELIKKKYPKFTGESGSGEINKIASFFLRRGFASDDIYKALREFKNNK